jgi:hypothetical protein
MKTNLEALITRIAELNPDAGVVVFPAGDGPGWNIDVVALSGSVSEDREDNGYWKDYGWIGYSAESVEAAAADALSYLLRNRDVVPRPRPT